MGGDRPALRGVAGIGCIVLAIICWEFIQNLEYKFGSGAGKEDVWRSAGQFAVEPSTANEAESNAVAAGEFISPDSQVGTALSDQVTVDPSSLSRQCLIGAFLRGTSGLENNIHSQRGEDGILQKVWECVIPTNRTFLELGVTGSSSSASRNLLDQGWTGLMLGSAPADPALSLVTETPNADTIVKTLQKHSTPAGVDLLAVHIDVSTFWVLQAMLQAGYQPQVIVAEINRNFHPTDTLVAPYDANQKWDGTTRFGAAAGAFDMLFEQLGYRTIAIDQYQANVYAVSAAAVGQPRLLSMAEITAGITQEQAPLCQGAQNCAGEAEWLEIDANVAPMLRMPRSQWYGQLPKWTVRCVPVTRAAGSNQVQVGVLAGTRPLPEYHPGVLSLVPCGRVADTTALADVIVAAQAGPARNGSGETAATPGNETAECQQHAEVVAQRRECVLSAFATGSTPQETRRYSQYYEDGIIDGIFACITPYDKFYVEFGVESGVECTTRHLREDGWTGLMMDGGYFRPEINLQQEFFNAEGIAWQFAKHAVPRRFDHLTVDIDQNTFWVLHAILVAGFRPRVIVAEINRNFHFNDTFVVPYDYHQMWVHTSMVFGAGPGAYDALFEAFGYHTIAMDQDQINIFAVHSCDVGAERLFSSDELVAGLQRAGPCAGIHNCNEGEFLQLTDEAVAQLTRPHYEWIHTLPRWWVVCSDPARNPDPNRPARLLTGKPMGEGGKPPVVPRFPPETVSKERCATVADATVDAEALTQA
eukprot:jgi/Ulvmu1/1221/UM109_0019.1